jgi:hypothetical protein
MARASGPEQFAVLDRRRHAARRYLRGETQWEIAFALEVDQATVSRDLKALREEWRANALMDVSARVAEELRKVDECEKCAWQAWARSQENAEVLKARMQGKDAVTEKTSKGQAGDPRFLELVLKCVARRCELLGLDAAKREGPADDDSVPLDERRTGLLGVLAALRQRPGTGPDSGAPPGDR